MFLNYIVINEKIPSKIDKDSDRNDLFPYFSLCRNLPEEVC